MNDPLDTKSNEIVVLEAAPPEKPEEEELSSTEVNNAIKSVGMDKLDLTKIRSYAKLAKALKKQGIVEVSRGVMAARAYDLEQARKAMLEVVMDTEVPLRDRRAAANILAVLVEQENATTELNLKLEALARSQPEKRETSQQLPPPGMNVVVVGPAAGTPVEKIVKPS